MQTRKIAMVLIVAVALTLLLAASFTTAGPPVEEGELGALAPVSTSFTYQGRLNDGGNPANGSYDFEFKLYSAADGGYQLGSTVSKGDVAVAEGLFTVELDFGSDRFTGDARWLEIGARPGGSTGAYTTLTPRQALTATPYALYALNAPWSGLIEVPSGFNDGVDDDTTYSAGEGLTLVGTAFSADTAYLQRRVSDSCADGNSVRVINEDGTVTCEPDDDTTYAAGTGLTLDGTTFSADAHDHWGETWSGSGKGLTLNSSDNDGVYVQSPGGDGFFVSSAVGTGVVVYSPGNDGVYVDDAGTNGVRVHSPGDDGVYVSDAGLDGVRVNFPGDDGIDVWSPGDDGVYVNLAGDDGVHIDSPSDHGVYVDSPGDDGFYVNSPGDNGVQVEFAGTNGVRVYKPGRDGIDVFNAARYGVYAATDATYGFYTHQKIYAGGGCVGCTSMLIAQNGDEELLEPGDLVAVAGLTDPVNPEAIQPILIVRKAESSFSQGVVGVVEGHYVYKVTTEQVSVERSKEGEEETGHSERMTEIINQEPAAPGEYMSVVYQGLAKVKVDASSSPITVGDLLSVSTTTGHAMKAQPLAIEGEKAAGGYLIGTVIGKALEPLNEGQGVIWVLVDLQ